MLGQIGFDGEFLPANFARIISLSFMDQADMASKVKIAVARIITKRTLFPFFFSLGGVDIFLMTFELTFHFEGRSTNLANFTGSLMNDLVSRQLVSRGETLRTKVFEDFFEKKNFVVLKLTFSAQIAEKPEIAF